MPKNNAVDTLLTPQLKQNIMNIAQAAPGLMEMLDWYHKKHKNVIEIPELKINSKALGEAIITKTFKISEKAVKKFIEFAEKVLPTFSIMNFTTRLNKSKFTILCLFVISLVMTELYIPSTI